MSISRVVLPVVDLEQNDNPLRKTVLKGAKHYTVQQIVPDSQSTNSLVFTVNPPSQNTVIDRRLDLAVPWEVKTTAAGFNPGLIVADNASEFARANCLFPDVWGFNATTLAASADLTNNNFLANAVPVHLINNLALRQFPMSSVMNSIDLVINGTHLSTEVKKYVHAVAKYTSVSYREWALGSVAHHPDNHYGSYFRQYTNVFDLSTTGAIRSAYTGAVNPLAMNANLGKDGETPRGYYWTLNTFQKGNAVSFDRNKGAFAEGATATNKVKSAGQLLKFTCIEPLMISPLSLHYGEGMTNINEIQVTVNWDTGKLNRILSGFSIGASTDTATQIKRVVSAETTNAVQTLDPDNQLTVQYAGTDAAEATNNARLLVRYYTAQDDIRIPNEIVLPYYQPRVFSQSITNLEGEENPDRSSGTYTGNVRRLDQIPSSVYLFARNKDANLEVSTPDAFLQISNLNVTFGNQTGILSGHNDYQLFKIAVENGADYESFYQSYQDEGLVLKLEFGKDIPLANNESPGTRGDYSIQISAQYNTGFVGIGGETAPLQNLEFREVYVNNGHVIISPNECRVQTGLLDIKDNIEAEDMGDHYDNRHANNLMGAGLFSTIGKFIGKAASGIAKHAPAIAKGLSTASDVANAAGNVAQSMSQGGSQTGGSVTGGSIVGGSATGGSMTGGRRLRSRRF